MSPVAVVVPLSETDLAAIGAIPGEWTRAAVKRDWDGVLALLTDDAALLPPDQPIVVGKPAIRAWNEAFPRIRTFVGRVEQTEGHGDFAWSRGTFEMTIEPTPGKAVRLVGKWSSTMRRQPDGRWLVNSNTWNADHPVTT